MENGVTPPTPVGFEHPELKKQDQEKPKEEKPKKEDDSKSKKPVKITAMATVNLDIFKNLIAKSVSIFKAKPDVLPAKLPTMSMSPRPFHKAPQSDSNLQASLSECEKGQVGDVGNGSGEAKWEGKEEFGEQGHLMSGTFPDTHRNRLIVSNNAMMLLENGAGVQRDSWILDSGANVHIVNDQKWFTEFIDIDYAVTTCRQCRLSPMSRRWKGFSVFERNR